MPDSGKRPIRPSLRAENATLAEPNRRLEHLLRELRRTV